MPKQSLVGLGWGDDEVMLNPFAPGDQGRAHLPRSPQGVSSIQLGLLKDATKVASDHPVTLTTHFTFLSYHEPIPCLTGPDPWPPVSTVPTVGKLEDTCKNDLGVRHLRGEPLGRPGPAVRTRSRSRAC